MSKQLKNCDEKFLKISKKLFTIISRYCKIQHVKVATKKLKL